MCILIAQTIDGYLPMPSPDHSERRSAQYCNNISSSLIWNIILRGRRDNGDAWAPGTLITKCLETQICAETQGEARSHFVQFKTQTASSEMRSEQRITQQCHWHSSSWHSSSWHSSVATPTSPQSDPGWKQRQQLNWCDQDYHEMNTFHTSGIYTFHIHTNIK